MFVSQCSGGRFVWEESNSGNGAAGSTRRHPGHGSKSRVLMTDARFGITFANTLRSGEDLAQYLLKRHRELRRDNQSGALIGANFEDLPWINQYTLNLTFGPHGFSGSLVALNVNSCGNAVTDTLLRGIAKRCTRLLSLSLRDAPEVTEKGFYDFITTCTTLERLNIADNPHLFPSHSEYVDERSMLRSLITCNPQLTHLDLSFCCGRHVCIQDMFNGLDAASSGERGTSQPNRQHEDVEALRRVCDSIDSGMAPMRLCAGPHGTNDGGYDFTETKDGKEESPSAPLAKLELGWGQLQLEHLDLSGCKRVNDAAVTAIATRCPGLRYLSLALAEAVTSAGILALSEGCSQLQYLDLTGLRRLDNTGATMVSTRCTRLETLLMGGCRKVTGSVLEAIARERANRASLRVVDISAWVDVTSQALQSFVNACPLLERLVAELVSSLDRETKSHLKGINPRLTIIARHPRATEPNLTGLVPGYKQPPIAQTMAVLFPNGGDVTVKKKKKGGGKKKKKK